MMESIPEEGGDFRMGDLENILDEMEECSKLVEQFRQFGNNLEKSYKVFCKDISKINKSKGAFVVPDVKLPTRLSEIMRHSVTYSKHDPLHDVTNTKHDDVGRKRKKNQFSSSPISSTSRKPRVAAVKCREGYMDAFSSLSKKLRRPTDFDESKNKKLMTPIQQEPDIPAYEEGQQHEESYVGLPICSSTFVRAAPRCELVDPECDDVFKKPAPICPLESKQETSNTKCHRQSRSRACKVTSSSVAKDNFHEMSTKIHPQDDFYHNSSNNPNTCVGISSTGNISEIIGELERRTHTLHEENYNVDPKQKIFILEATQNLEDFKQSEHKEEMNKHTLSPMMTRDSRSRSRSNKQNETTVTVNQDGTTTHEDTNATGTRTRTKTKRNHIETTAVLSKDELEKTTTCESGRTRSKVRRKENDTRENTGTEQSELLAATTSEIVEQSRTRTKTLRKKQEGTIVSDTKDESGEIDLPQTITTKTVETTRSRSKTGRKQEDTTIQNSIDDTEQNRLPQTDTQEEVVEGSRTRTKTLRKNQEAVVPETERNEVLTNANVEGSRTRTKTLRKKQDVTEDPKDTEVVAQQNELHTLTALEGIEGSRTRTKPIRKKQEDTVVSAVADDIQQTELHANAAPGITEGLRTRTKTIKKKTEDTIVPAVADDVQQTELHTSTAPEAIEGSRTRTKTIRKKQENAIVPAVADDVQQTELHTSTAPEVIEGSRTRTKTLRKKQEDAIVVSTEGGIPKVELSADPYTSTENTEGSRTRTKTLRKRKLDEGADVDTEHEEVKMSKQTPAGEVDNSSLLNRDVNHKEHTPRLSKKMRQSYPQNSQSDSNNFQIISDIIISGTPVADMVTSSSKSQKPPAKLFTSPKELKAEKKKRELILQKKEEIRKNRELKTKKAAESRAAVEKEKILRMAREKREKEEKDRQKRAELMKQKEEALLKKKLLNQQKAQEAEERRQREEQIRMAKLREQEEEQRKAMESRQRQLEEAEKLAALRRLQEKEENALRQLLKEKEKAKKLAKPTSAEQSNVDDCGIDDDDDEDHPPKRPLPKWVDQKDASLKAQFYANDSFVYSYFFSFDKTPDIRKMFGRDAKLRPRTSSAVWDTPPQ